MLFVVKCYILDKSSSSCSHDEWLYSTFLFMDRQHQPSFIWMSFPGPIIPLLVLLMDFLHWAEPAGVTEQQQPNCSATHLVTHRHSEVCQLLSASGPWTNPDVSLVWAGRQERAWELGSNQQNVFGWWMHHWSIWRAPTWSYEGPLWLWKSSVHEAERSTE